MESRQINPIQDLFIDIKKIIDFLEVKDDRAAEAVETQESRENAELWIVATTEQDSYFTWYKYWTISMFQEVVSNVRINHVQDWMQYPLNVPIQYRDNLLRRGREEFLNQYIEKNSYYRALNGLPPIDTPAHEYIYLSESLRNQFDIPNKPIHELSTLIQNRFIATEAYQKIIEENPDKEYLKYIGIYKIDPLVSRQARDFEIIRYLPISRSDINPHLLKEFGSIYSRYREYVMGVLYNKQLENVYEGYRTFMRLLIISFTLMQISNKAIESKTDRRFLDDIIIHIILQMYRIPRTLLMTKEVRRNLVSNLLKLIQEKGTDQVYYSLIRVLDYHDVVINKLMLVRGQEFEDNGQAIFKDADHTPMKDFYDMDKIMDMSIYKPDNEYLKVNPHFIPVDIKDPNPYDTIINTQITDPATNYKEITDPDPTWWNMPDTLHLVQNSNYSIADSKYISIEAVIHQVRYLFEAVYFTRLVLDNMEYTDKFMITIPEIFGTEPISIYDVMVFIVVATCMNTGLSGEISTPEQGLHATAGFNFDVDMDMFEAYIQSTRFVDKDRIMVFLENLSMRTPSDINRLFNEVIQPMRDWLEAKMSQSNNRREFLEYEAVYKSLFTYDVAKHHFLDCFVIPMEVIREKYNLTEDEIIMFKLFYPHKYTDNKSLTINDFGSTGYAGINNMGISWHVNVDFKGVLYFHDILNYHDVRDIKLPDGNYMFMEKVLNTKDEWTGEWQVDRDAVQSAVKAIENISSRQLRNASMIVDTAIPESGGQSIRQFTKLPARLRSEGVFKNILIDKIVMDTQGLAHPPTTYVEYLRRRNPKLHDLLMRDDRRVYDHNGWVNDIMTVVTILESELNMHVKYFEQSIAGPELFFRPLIMLIERFKSQLTHIAKTSIKYVFGCKLDTGGNSNMLKIFDNMRTVIHFVILASGGRYAQFGLYDTEHKIKYGIILNDKSQLMEGGAKHRESWMGSMRMVDEMKFYKNGKEIDPSDHTSAFYIGEPGSGRWTDDADFIMRRRIGSERIKNNPVDLEGWKDLVEVNVEQI